MPQFQTTYFVSQIFWLLFSFGGLYLGIQFVIFPLFEDTFKKRQQQKEELLMQAEALTQKAQDLEEKKAQKHLLQEKKHQQRVNQAQEKAFADFQKMSEENEKHLMKILKNKIQKMERDENGVLKEWDALLIKALKGKQ